LRRRRAGLADEAARLTLPTISVIGDRDPPIKVLSSALINEPTEQLGE